MLVGMMHGLAGSASVMLFVLSTIPSPALGFAYLAVFGVGSLGGMVLMSALVSVPAHLTARRFGRTHLAVRGVAAVASVACGLGMVVDVGRALAGLL
jgi:high-affinity nickel-transport protein